MLPRLFLWKIMLGIGGALLLDSGNSIAYAFPGDGADGFAGMGSFDSEESSSSSQSSDSSSNVFEEESQTGPQGARSLSVRQENENARESSRRSDLYVTEDEGGDEEDFDESRAGQESRRNSRLEELEIRRRGLRPPLARR